MAKNNLIYNQNPFKNVAISGWVLAPDGSKMSKSKGNTIAPQDIVEKFSNDALRFAAASNKLGYDAPFQEKEVKTGTNVVNKMYNSVKFASMLLDDCEKEDTIINVEELNGVDRGILSNLQYIIKESQKAFEEFDYAKAKALWTDFFMNSVCDNYLEIVKQRLWQKQDNYKSAQKTLYKVLFESVKGLAPIIPFITEEVYQKFFKEFEGKESIHLTSYPVNEENLKIKTEHGYNLFLEIVAAVRTKKSQLQISQKEHLEENILKELFREFRVQKEAIEFIKDNKQDLENVINTIITDEVIEEIKVEE